MAASCSPHGHLPLPLFPPSDVFLPPRCAPFRLPLQNPLLSSRRELASRPGPDCLLLSPPQAACRKSARSVNLAHPQTPFESASSKLPLRVLACSFWKS
eukprot:3754287-Rhodomonas_salina.3